MFAKCPISVQFLSSYALTFFKLDKAKKSFETSSTFGMIRQDIALVCREC